MAVKTEREMVIPVENVEDGGKEAGKPGSTERPRRNKQRAQQQSVKCKHNVDVEVHCLRCILYTMKTARRYQTRLVHSLA